MMKDYVEKNCPQLVFPKNLINLSERLLKGNSLRIIYDPQDMRYILWIMIYLMKHNPNTIIIESLKEGFGIMEFTENSLWVKASPHMQYKNPCDLFILNYIYSIDYVEHSLRSCLNLRGDYIAICSNTSEFYQYFLDKGFTTC